MFPPTLEVGPLRLAWSGIVMATGFLLAFGRFVWQQRGAGEGWLDPARRTVDSTWMAFLLALVAGRAATVAGQGSYFLEHPAEALQFWQGGISAHGALAGFLLGWWVQRRSAATVRASFDQMILSLAVLQTAAWARCWLAGCAYGAPIDVTRQPWFAPFDWPDLYGIHAPRVPVQLFGVLAGLLLVALCLRLGRTDWAPGRRFALVLALGGLLDFGLQQIRADETLLLAGQRVAAWLDLGFVLLAVVLLLVPRRG